MLILREHRAPDRRETSLHCSSLLPHTRAIYTNVVEVLAGGRVFF
jgi:hypothetical protein